MFDLRRHRTTKLKRSVFGHIFERDGILCFYNSLKILPVYFDAALREYVLALEEHSIDSVLREAPGNLRETVSDLAETLCKAHILVPHDYDEKSYLDRIRQYIFMGPRIRVLVLHLTDFCNLECRYCFIEGGKQSDYENMHMTSEVAIAALNKFAATIQLDRLPKPPSVVFYGGEPLLNFSILHSALEHIRFLQDGNRLPSRVDKIVITNGTRITQDIAEILRDHGVSISVSLDGPEFLHNQNRVYHSGRGSFQDSLRGFDILKSAGLCPSVSCVLSEPSLEHIPEIMHWLLDDLEVRALGFNHISIVPDVSQYDPIYESRFADAVIGSHEILLQYPDVYERRMSRKLSSFLDREILKADCTGCGEQMAVSPDGKIGICQGYMGTRSTFVGNVFDESFNPASHPLFVEWSHRSPLNMPYCHDCPSLAICGGGCPRNAEYTSGSIWDPDIAFCHFAKRSLEWMIWKVYDVATSYQI